LKVVVTQSSGTVNKKNKKKINNETDYEHKVQDLKMEEACIHFHLETREHYL